MNEIGRTQSLCAECKAASCDCKAKMWTVYCRNRRSGQVVDWHGGDRGVGGRTRERACAAREESARSHSYEWEYSPVQRVTDPPYDFGKADFATAAASLGSESVVPLSGCGHAADGDVCQCWGFTFVAPNGKRMFANCYENPETRRGWYGSRGNRAWAEAAVSRSNASTSTLARSMYAVTRRDPSVTGDDGHDYAAANPAATDGFVYHEPVVSPLCGLDWCGRPLAGHTREEQDRCASYVVEREAVVGECARYLRELRVPADAVWITPSLRALEPHGDAGSWRRHAEAKRDAALETLERRYRSLTWRPDGGE